jgi:hypothetical protein
MPSLRWLAFTDPSREAALDKEVKAVRMTAVKKRSASRFPSALLGTLLLAGLTESLIRRYTDGLAGPAEIEWGQTARAVALARGSAIVAMGDSLVKSGVIPHTIEATLADKRRVYNIALSASPTVTSYYFLRRLIALGGAPEVVLLDAHALTHSARTPISPLPWQLALTTWELAELAWAFGDPEFFTEELGRKHLPSMRRRAAIREHARAAMWGHATASRILAWIVAYNSNRNRGCLLLPDREPDRIPPSGSSSTWSLNEFSKPWLADPVQRGYVESYLALAAKARIKVYWLMMPSEPELDTLREQNGHWPACVAYLRDLQERYAKVIVVDGRRAGYPAEAMSDILHLSRSGALAFSDALGQILTTADPAERWIALPRYDADRALMPAERSPARNICQSI